jgi:drug/metabolite transporter (DMT)-like permease
VSRTGTSWPAVRMTASLALAGYCVATAVSATWVSFSFVHISGLALTFVTFALAQVVYIARAGRGIRSAVRFAASYPKEVAVLNILTLASWLFMFMALQRIEASVESAIYQGIVAITGFILAAVVSGQRFSRAARLGVIAAAAGLGLLVAARLELTLSALKHGSSALVGVVLALVAGTTGGLYIHYSSVLHRRTQVTTNTVLFMRFLLLLVVTGAGSAHEVVTLLGSSQSTIMRLLVLSVAFVVLPTFFLQYAIARLPSVRVSVVTPFVSMIALGSEYAVRPWGSIGIPLLVLAATAALVFTNLALSRDFARNAQAPSRNEMQPLLSARTADPGVDGERRS